MVTGGGVGEDKLGDGDWHIYMTDNSEEPAVYSIEDSGLCNGLFGKRI